jgi:hypothetical protein
LSEKSKREASPSKRQLASVTIANDKEIGPGMIQVVPRKCILRKKA